MSYKGNKTERIIVTKFIGEKIVNLVYPVILWMLQKRKKRIVTFNSGSSSVDYRWRKEKNQQYINYI